MKTTKKLVGSLFLSLILATAISCSSNDKKDDGASADVAEATSDLDGAPQDGAPQDGSAPVADDQNAPPAEGDQAAAADGTTPPPADGDNKSPSANSELAALDAPPDAAGQGGDMATDQSAATPPADPNAAPADPNAPPAADAGAQANADAPPAPATPADDSAVNAPPPADAAPAPAAGDSFAGAAVADNSSNDAPHPKKSGGALAHIKDSPFSRGGQNLNTVYVAREGDTLDSISQKLFGEDRSKVLKKGNPTLKKGVKTGDKVYFNSPNRPDDKEKMMTVYEDQGLPPSVYTSKDGDTLKSLSQEWYGTEGSYKEIYAVNKGLTSTKDLPPGTELQYWPASANVAVYGAKKEAEVAQNPPPPAPEAPAAMPPGGPGVPPGGPGAPGAPGNMQQPPGMANNNMPPGGPGAPGAPPAAGMMDPNAPPPPGGPDMSGAPGAPPMGSHHKTKDLSATGGMDKDTIFYAGLAGILLISSALWFALRRRRSRNSGVTQI